MSQVTSAARDGSTPPDARARDRARSISIWAAHRWLVLLCLPLVASLGLAVLALGGATQATASMRRDVRDPSSAIADVPASETEDDDEDASETPAVPSTRDDGGVDAPRALAPAIDPRKRRASPGLGRGPPRHGR
jgi:hypothetical protein